jgi:hypothetical protein
MKDKLGRDIIAGDKVVVLETDYNSFDRYGPGGRLHLKVYAVAKVADFGIQVDADGEFRVYTNPELLVIAK